MLINSFSGLLWTMAGMAFGIAAVAWLTTAQTARVRQNENRRSTTTWQSWHELLLALRGNPGDVRARRQLVEALDRSADDPRTLPLLAKTLAVHGDEPELSEAIARSRVRHQIHVALESDDAEQQVPALQIVAGLNGTEDLPLVLLLAMSADREVARTAIGTLEHLDPAAALDLLFQAIRTEGLWAFHLLQSVLRRGALDPWLATRNEGSLNDVVALLGMLALTADEAVRLAVVDVLAVISHRTATQALGRLARGKGSVADAARETLATTPTGRVLLAKLDLDLDLDLDPRRSAARADSSPSPVRV